jgi:hypothetical protein
LLSPNLCPHGHLLASPEEIIEDEAITAAFEKFTAEASIIVKPQEHRSGSVEKKREP